MRRLLPAAAVLAAAQIVPSCAWLLGFRSPDEYYDGPAPPPIEPMDGPEHPEVVNGLHGWILQHDYGSDDVIARELPSLEERTIHLDEPALRVSAPDDQGRFVYGYGELRLQHLRVRSLAGGTEEEIPLPGTKSHRYVKWFALSPHGGRLAIGFTPEEFSWIDDPIGVEIWNIGSNEHRSLDAPTVFDAVWFPDERRLLVDTVASKPPEHHAPPEIENPRGLPEQMETVRAVQTLDVETNAFEWVCPGGRHCLSSDGKLLVHCDASRRWQIRDLETGAETELTLPGALGGPYAWLGTSTLLYPARPTAGQDPGVLRTMTQFPRANWTAKAAHPGDWGFVTVSPSVGRFDAFAIGPVRSDP